MYTGVISSIGASDSTHPRQDAYAGAIPDNRIVAAVSTSNTAGTQCGCMVLLLFVAL